MNFLNLYYFSIAAEELNFTKAAKRLFISQQSLSNHISRLESEFGVVLFNRTQPVTLTDAGETLYRRSQNLLDEKKQLETAMQDLRDFRKGELTIGISTSRGAVILPDILPEFHTLFPQIDLKLVEGTTLEINRALYEGRADLRIGFAMDDPDQVHEELLHTEHLVCAVPNSFLKKYLAPDKPYPYPGTMQDFRLFADCPFIKMQHNVWLGEMFEKCCRHYQVEPSVVLETSSMSTLVSLCSVGLGSIVLPEIFATRVSLFMTPYDWKSSVSVFPLDFPAGTQSITVSYLKGHYLNRAAAEFIRMACKKFTY